MGTPMRIFRDAAIAVVISSAVALAFNAVRQDGIPLIADKPYEIFVPCPEPLGEVSGIPPASSLLDDAEVRSGRTLVLDAGTAAEYSSWHFRGAWSVPFDYIDPVPDRTVRKIAASGARRVVVYGDGGEPDSGRELARELAGRGITGVYFVIGGQTALKAARGNR